MLFMTELHILQTLELLSINVLSTALSVIMMLRQEIKEVIALFAILGTNSQEFFALLTAEMGRSMATKLVMTGLTMERDALLGALGSIHFILVLLDQLQQQLFAIQNVETGRLLTLEISVMTETQQITEIV